MQEESTPKKIQVNCLRCGEAKFEFSVELLRVTGIVDCFCENCGVRTRVELTDEVVTLSPHN